MYCNCYGRYLPRIVLVVLIGGYVNMFAFFIEIMFVLLKLVYMYYFPDLYFRWLFCQGRGVEVSCYF